MPTALLRVIDELVLTGLGPLPQSYRLPGMPDGMPTSSRRAVAVVIAAGLAAIGWLAAAGANTWAHAGVVVATVLMCAAVHRLRAWLHCHRLHRALRAFAPQIALVYAGKSGGSWQLGMWEPALLHSGLPLVVINWHQGYLAMALDGTSVPVIQVGRTSQRAIDGLVVPTLRAFFYVQNARRNVEFMRYEHLTHVWLGHGDSDKPASFNARHARYDRVVVSGQAAIDRYAVHGIHMDPDRFELLGRPQIADIRRASTPVSQIDAPTVLYAPTWQGVEGSINFSSLSRGPRIVRALVARGCIVVFRPHPLSHRWKRQRRIIGRVHDILEADSAGSGRPHVYGDAAETVWSVADCCNHADALISDVSSVVTDFLQSEKPYAMVSMHTGVAAFRAEFSLARTGYVINRRLRNIQAVLNRLLVDDPLAEARIARKRYVLGELDGQASTEAFAEFVRRVGRAERAPRLVP